MSDLRTYNPQLFGQVLEEVKKEKDLDKINTLGRNIYYKISEGK